MGRANFTCSSAIPICAASVGPIQMGTMRAFPAGVSSTGCSTSTDGWFCPATTNVNTFNGTMIRPLL